METVTLNQTTQGIQFHSPYDASLIADLKMRIKAKRPVYENGKFQYWLIDPSEKTALISICKQNGYEPIVTGHNTTQGNQPKVEMLKIMYIGQCKQRPDGTVSAYGHFNNDWCVVFPEEVLKGWFDAGLSLSSTSQSDTLHGVLGLRWNEVMELPPIKADSAIKKAYRKQMKRYHPDVNKDDDAAEMTMKVQSAYEKLSQHHARVKYQVGLKLQAQYEIEQVNQPSIFNSKNYRPPVRCGMILALGMWKVGRFYVDEIKSWRAIKDSQGREMVSSWPKGSDKFVVNWI